ncbi:MAG: ankyrin repeat domain-containing protein [Wolbachia sp.]
MIESGIDVNYSFPFHCAAELGHLQVAEILLAAKANVNMHDQYKLIPLDDAVELGNKIEMVKLLLKKRSY